VFAMKPAAEVTVILGDLRAGRAGAAERLSALVYDELRAMAGAMMSQERAAHTLQPTALVHEAFVRMSGSDGLDANDRKHFMAIAAKVMRQVLIDHARAKRADKRGGGKVLAGVEGLDSTVTPGTSGGTRELDVLDLDDALRALAEEYPRAARVVELRFFGGLQVPETAAVLGIAEPTVERDWALARGWLKRRMEGEKK
jgi:RNA polymerase sigma-70 factor, ECF subfamily